MQRFTNACFHGRQPRTLSYRQLRRESHCTSLLVTIYCLIKSGVGSPASTSPASEAFCQLRANAFVMRHQVCHAKKAKQLTDIQTYIQTYVHEQICTHFVRGVNTLCRQGLKHLQHFRKKHATACLLCKISTHTCTGAISVLQLCAVATE